MQAGLRGAAAAGWHPAGTAQTMPGGPASGFTFEYLTDPDGTVLELIQPPRSTHGSSRLQHALCELRAGSHVELAERFP